MADPIDSPNSNIPAQPTSIQPAVPSQPPASTSGIKNNIGKFVVLVIYVLVVFTAPLVFQLPFTQEKLGQFSQTLFPQDTDQLFRNYISLLKSGDIEQAYPMMSEGARQQTSTSSAQQAATYFANITSQMERIGTQVHSFSSPSTNRTDYVVTYEVTNNDSKYPYALISIRAEDAGNGVQILGVDISQETQSIKEQSKFNFATDGIYFIIALLIPLFIAYTAFRYLTKAKNPHWVMFLAILLLAVYVSIVNTSDNFNLTFHFGVYGFMSKNGLYAPWVFMTPIPLGAIYYYFVRKKYE